MTGNELGRPLDPGSTRPASAAPAWALPLTVPAELLDIVEAVRRHRGEYAERIGEYPDVMVLAGARLWRRLLYKATGGAVPWAARNPENPDELVLIVYNARVVRSGIPVDEWQLVVRTDWRGTVKG